MFKYKKLIIIIFLIAMPFSVQAAGTCSFSGLLTGGLSKLIPKGLTGGTSVPVRESARLLDLTETLTNKECLLDGIASALTREILEKLTGDILGFTTGGFDGNPAYIENLNDYWKEVGDEAAEKFLNGDEVSSLPDSDKVRNEIAEQYYQTFDEEWGYDGSKTKYSDEFGSWGDWSKYVVHGYDDIYSQIWVTKKELEKNVLSAVDEAQKEAEYGDGYKSLKECEEDKENDGNCDIKTPGTNIKAEVDTTISSPTRQLELADEIDEIINSLLSQLSTKILGKGGLSGLGRSSGGKSSYISSIQSGGGSSNVDQTREDTIAFIDSVESTEKRYLEIKIATMSVLTGSELLLESLMECNSSTAEISQEIINTEIIPRQITVQGDINNSNSILAQLNDSRDMALQTKNSTVLKNIIFEIENSSTHGYTSLIEAENDQQNRIDEMAVIDEETNANLAQCNL